MEPARADRNQKLSILRRQPPSALLADPMEFLLAEHARQRTLCDVLDDIADADADADADEVDPELVAAALHFLKDDFRRHVLDEENGLFPALENLGRADTRFRDVLAQLHAQHDTHRTVAKDIVAALERLQSDSKTQGPDRDLASVLRNFAAIEREHLILENGIVLPIAKAELSDAILDQLSREMMARRGIETEGDDLAG
jgi:hemerythrin-like domain-containing protein